MENYCWLAVMFYGMRFLLLSLVFFLPGTGNAQYPSAGITPRDDEHVIYQSLLGYWHLSCRQQTNNNSSPVNCQAQFTVTKRVAGYLDPVFRFDMMIMPEPTPGKKNPFRYDVKFQATPSPDWREGMVRIGTWESSLKKSCQYGVCILSEKTANQLINRMRAGASRSNIVFRDDVNKRQVDIPLYNFDAIMQTLEQQMIAFNQQ